MTDLLRQIGRKDMLDEQIVRMLKEDARLSAAAMAARLNRREEEVAERVKALEDAQIIQGYTAVINEDALSDGKVRALIEVRVTPRRDGGFDEVARRIARFPEVIRLYLVSGNYDLLLEVEGDSLQEVASFVSAKLATIDGVLSTATSFQLKKYKESGRIMGEEEDYERLKICP